MTELQKAKSILSEKSLTCAIVKESEIYESTLRGVKPLLDLLESGVDFKGGFAADKVVGKGAAFLYVLIGVKEVYADVISSPALEILVHNGIKTEYRTLVPNIINRKGDGICPIETAVLNETDPKGALIKIKETLKNLSK